MKRLWRLLVALAVCYTIVSVGTADIVVLQPGPDTGKDKGAYDPTNLEPYYNSPYTQYTLVMYSTCDASDANGYLQFNLTGLPTENIISAEIQTYTQVFFNGAGSPWVIDPVIAVREVTSPWDETTLSWNNQPSYNSTILDSHKIETVGGGSSGNPYYEYDGWLSYDINDLYVDWVEGRKPNYGVRFSSEVGQCLNGDLIWYYESSYGSDPLLRPKLVVTYGSNPAISGPTITFESRTTPTGSTVQIPVTLKEVTDTIGNMDLTLQYDPNVLDAREVIKGPLTQSDIFDYNIVPGTIKVSFASTEGFGGDGVIAYVKFNVTGAAGSSSPLKIANVSANNANDLQATTISAKDGLFKVTTTVAGSGDADGDGSYTAVDALAALQMSVGKTAKQSFMDMNQDGDITSLDARMILQLAVK